MYTTPEKANIAMFLAYMRKDDPLLLRDTTPSLIPVQFLNPESKKVTGYRFMTFSVNAERAIRSSNSNANK
jgi:hypothetical protein